MTGGADVLSGAGDGVAARHADRGGGGDENDEFTHWMRSPLKTLVFNAQLLCGFRVADN